MSSNSNDTINLSNYEEWFVLYMDNELNADDKATVESFLLLHPHFQEELDVLLNTKLPAEELVFWGKEDLKAEAMKLNAVDESLLLYLDNELSATDKKRFDEKLAADKNLQLQYEALQRAKLDASETVPYPDKKELYRHTEKVFSLAVWMRVAAAVVLILFGTLFFVLSQSDKTIVPSVDVVQIDEPVKPKNIQPSINKIPAINNDSNLLLQQSTAALKTEKQDKIEPNKKKTTVDVLQKQLSQQDVVTSEEKRESIALPTVESIKIDVAKLAEQPIVVINNSTRNLPVTPHGVDSLKQNEYPEITADINGGKSKKTSAKGLLRRVSRFIGRRTGIGTVNADNEMLVGMVALKLN